MTQYILRRLMLFVPTAFGVSVLIFFMLQSIPGDYCTASLLSGREVQLGLTNETFERCREHLGLEDSIVSQYVGWVGNVLQGSFGTSLTNRLEVVDNLIPRIRVSAQLAVMALTISVVIAIPAGIFAAIKQDRWPDYILRGLSMTFEAMPGFWVALLIILGLLHFFHWIPPVTYRNLWDEPWTNMQIMIFPALVVGARASAGMLRMTRSAVLEVVREDYIRTAMAKGLHQQTVLFIHVLKNSMLPVVTLAGFELVFMMGGIVIIETVFQIPGVGQEFVRSAARRDWPTVQAIVMWVAGTVLVANLVVDILYSWLDPRIRYA